jgi:hypothetical protein
MFEDREVNAGLLYALYVFTQTYCAEYKDQACDVWTTYNRGGIRIMMCSGDILYACDVTSGHVTSGDVIIGKSRLL